MISLNEFSFYNVSLTSADNKNSLLCTTSLWGENDNRMFTQPALVVFDLYGTLVQFGVMHRPFKKILLWARDCGREQRGDDARKIMTANMDCEDLLAVLGIFPPPELLELLYREIQEELDNLTLYDDVLPTLKELTNKGISIAICSNLAKPYGAVIDRLLSQTDILRCLSYEVGSIKPESEIYEWIARKSGISADQTLFVGDNRLADYEGPKEYGFGALHLVRNQSVRCDEIASLTEIIALLRR